MEEIQEDGVMHVTGVDDHGGGDHEVADHGEGDQGGGGDQEGGGEVVQVIMQDDGNVIMPEGQFIQVNTDDGQPQFIQVTDNNGENQLIQLMPDGQAHVVQVQEGPDGNTHIIQVAPASMDFGGEQSGLTIVNMEDAPPDNINQDAEQTEEHMHLQEGDYDGESGQQDVMGSVIINPDEESSTLDHQTSDMSAEQEEQQQHIVIDHHSESTQDNEGGANSQDYHSVTHRPRQTIITIHPKMDHHVGQSAVSVNQSVAETQHGITTSVACTTMAEINSVEQSAPRVAKGVKSSIATRVVPSSAPHTASSSNSNSGSDIKPKAKNLDMTSPIPLTTETIVVVNGKRCVLRVDPQSSNLVAYPFTPTPVPGKRGRGRPRKVRPLEGESSKFVPESPSSSQKSTASQDSDNSQSASEWSLDTPTGTPTKKDGLSEQENSAAEGLLGLSEDGVRRSRRKRKRATFLSDYEMGAVEGVAEEDDEEDSKEGILEGLKRPRGRPPSGSPKAQATAPNNAMQTLLMNMGFIPKKRGRGRPRRNPLPTTVQTNTGGVPTFIIQQPGGSAVMMSPMQTIEGFQKNLVTIKAKPSPQELIVDKAQTPASIVIQNADGTETQIDTAPVEPTLPPQEEVGDDVEGHIITDVEGSVQPTEGDEMEEEEALKPEEVLKADGQEQEKEIMAKPVTDILDSGALDDDVADPDYEPGGPIEEEDDEDIVEKDSPEPKKRKLHDSAMQQPTIIQLPDNIVPLMIPKKTPVKIGLKATESDLEKLKCPKCDFQAYYQQQFQEHIATHIDDIHKCKCCNFLTFEKDGLLGHFREAHPKCICPVCDFMAEHAYIIKRHMMRHSANGCECNLCGKRYKDQYILKMHLKMVHMPAEVLYECQVCTKKFTRKAHLKRHLRIHEPEKPFKCSHCDYRGCERSDITKHLLIHEEPRHVCEVCGKAFRHIKNKELHVKRHKGQRDYKCGVCDFYGYTFTDIRKHIERKHTDNRNILCDKCGSAFKNDVLLREHQKQQCELLMFEASLPVEEEVTEGDGQTIHHTIHVPHDQYVVDQAQVTDQQQQQQIMVNGNQVNITVEQLDHLEGLSHHQEQLTGGEVTVVHMDDIQGTGAEELGEEELLEEEEQLQQHGQLQEDLAIEDGQVQEEEVAVAGIVSSMAEDVHIITVSPEDAQEQGMVVEMGGEDMGQVVYEQQVIEQEVIEQQVMEQHDMNQQMNEEAIGEQLLIELVQ